MMKHIQGLLWVRENQTLKESPWAQEAKVSPPNTASWLLLLESLFHHGLGTFV